MWGSENEASAHINCTPPLPPPFALGCGFKGAEPISGLNRLEIKFSIIIKSPQDMVLHYFCIKPEILGKLSGYIIADA